MNSGSHHQLEEELRALLRDVESGGVVSAAAGLLGSQKHVLATAASGAEKWREGVTLATGSLFDLASLAKPLSATLALQLDSEGAFPLKTKVGDVWESLHRGIAETRVEDLLRHRAGFRAWAPLYALAFTRDEAVDLLLSGRLKADGEPVYSDLGYILWGVCVEKALEKPLFDLLDSRVLEPLGIRGEIVEAGRLEAARLVTCQLEPKKERELASEQGVSVSLRAPTPGESQDGNARWWGGYCGHAGLFGSVFGLWSLAREWISPRVLDVAAVGKALEGEGRYRLGWWSGEGHACVESKFGSATFGHNGFTGGSVWFDSSRGRIFVLLAHRLEDSMDMNPWRRRLHAMA